MTNQHRANPPILQMRPSLAKLKRAVEKHLMHHDHDREGACGLGCALRMGPPPRRMMEENGDKYNAEGGGGHLQALCDYLYQELQDADLYDRKMAK